MVGNRALSSAKGFRVQRRESEDCTVVECFGRLTIENVPLLKDAMREVCERKGRIVLDLKEVPMMDSSGLGNSNAARFGADTGLPVGGGKREQADFGNIQHDERTVIVRRGGTLRQADVSIRGMPGSLKVSPFVRQ